MAPLLKELYPKEVAALEKGAKDLWVEFYGQDGYYASVPLEHVINASNDVLLATHMNGAPMTADHGYPVRVLLPGVVGARNAKWLEKVVVRSGEGDSPWNNYYYKNKSIPKDPATGGFVSAMKMPLNCTILKTTADPQLRGDKQVIRVSGIVFNGAGQEIEQVEVTTDEGKNWQPARMLSEEVLQDDSSKHWHWLRWRVEALVDIQTSNSEVWARAKIADADKLPDPDGLYKIGPISEKRGGYLYNGYHKVNFVDNTYQRMGAHQCQDAGMANNAALGEEWTSKKGQL